MIFKDFAKADGLNYQERYESENGKWEFGIHKMGFGVRIRAGEIGRSFVSIDSEAGTDPLDIMKVLLAVKIFLEAFPEDTNEMMIHLCWPLQASRPYKNDPEFVEWCESVICDGYVYDSLHPKIKRLPHFNLADIL
jgi:hypothetical protein